MTARTLFLATLSETCPIDAVSYTGAIDLLCNETTGTGVCGETLLNAVTELSSDLPLQHADVTILRGLCRGNSGLYLGLAKNRLVVVKEHVFAAGSFLLTSNVLYELCTLLYMRLARATAFADVTRCLPNLLQIDTARNSLRIVMEHLPMSVEDVCDRRLPIPFLTHIFWQLANVVERLHSLDMCHRDIKPANIRFRADGTPVLIDYDSCILLAKCERYADTFPICTLSARAPELLVSDAPGSYDAKALDVFSLGLTFIYMANTSRPLVPAVGTVEEQSVTLLRSIATLGGGGGSSSLHMRLGDDLMNIVLKMLQVQPLDRPTMQQVKHMLRRPDSPPNCPFNRKKIEPVGVGVAPV